MKQIQVFCQNRQPTKTNGFSKGTKYSVNSSSSLLVSSAFILSPTHFLISQKCGSWPSSSQWEERGSRLGILGSCNCFATSSHSEPEKGVSFWGFVRLEISSISVISQFWSKYYFLLFFLLLRLTVVSLCVFILCSQRPRFGTNSLLSLCSDVILPLLSYFLFSTYFQTLIFFSAEV